MEIEEQDRHMKVRETKITKGMDKILAKHQIEMASLEKKLVN